MKLKDKIYCNNIGVYEGQLSKRKSYIVEEINSENIRIKNDENKLKWYSKFYFEFEKQAEINSITIDDKIQNIDCDCIEVTIKFENNLKYWTRFITPKYLSKILENQNYITGNKLIIIEKLTNENIIEIIYNLDSINELIENCNIY
ncbi:hypothetical protein [Soonwooa purpurea]